ncbi:hypothetical protein QM012_003667 [Aureobasidium pullulans]|uniref:F-box domain-containing protein n=1 Tax=Aureobasidium pullulans TaxID=5580 RepID=A0ABR0T7J8_AURPU
MHHTFKRNTSPAGEGYLRHTVERDWWNRGNFHLNSQFIVKADTTTTLSVLCFHPSLGPLASSKLQQALSLHYTPLLHLTFDHPQLHDVLLPVDFLCVYYPITSFAIDQDGELPSISGVPFGKLPSEIQSQIGKYLDKKSLFTAIFVNKEWFVRLIGLLWYRAPIEKVLADSQTITTKSRRQYYATMICRGSLKTLPIQPDRESIEKLLEGLEFKSIRILHVDSPGTLHETWLGPLLRPTLQSLFTRVRCPISTTLVKLLTDCTRLHTLALGGCEWAHDEKDFLRYLREAPSLRRVRLKSVPLTGDTPFPAGPLVELLRRGNLKELVISDMLSNDCFVEHLRAPIVVPFPSNANLRSLKLRGHPSAINICLATATISLKRLELIFYATGQNAFDQLGRFTNLRTLYISKFGVRTIGPSELDTLCALTQLTTLVIDSDLTRFGRGRLFDLSWLSDAYFASWIAHFSRLRTLRLGWECDLTRNDFISIARSCPRLTCCELRWIQDLNTWNLLLMLAPLLPYLQTLNFATIDQLLPASELDLSASAARTIVPIICALFPGLRNFSVKVEVRTEFATDPSQLNEIIGTILELR